jgi:hypothetical protein
MLEVACASFPPLSGTWRAASRTHPEQANTALFDFFTLLTSRVPAAYVPDTSRA